jgi:hypothetical protein
VKVLCAKFTNSKLKPVTEARDGKLRLVGNQLRHGKGRGTFLMAHLSAAK